MAQTKPKAGQFYGVSGNGTDGQFLQTDGAGGMAWADTTVDPTLSSIDYPGTQTAADPAGGESIIINGTGFQTGITCTVGGTSATTAFNSATQITITSPAKAAGQYTVAVTNTDGGSGSSANFIQYSGVPVWTTNSGSLGTVQEGGTTAFQVTATEGSDTIEYAVTSGSLPSGYSLATATGAITGTAGAVSADTTSTFSITATDDENQTSSARSFSITVTNDVPSNYFNTVLYTGNSSTQSITGVGFKPDLTWVKDRNVAYQHNLYDSLRGVEALESNSTTAQYNLGGLTSFDSDGFSLGSNVGNNLNNSPLVSWNWKAGGAPTATNAAAAGSVPTLGSVMVDGAASTSALAGTLAAMKISANTTLGFSIIQYNGGTGTLPHELGVTPRLIIQKNQAATNPWYTYVPPGVIDANYNYLELNTDAATGTTGSTAPTSTTFNPASTNTGPFIAYAFADKAGFCKIDKYTGNGSGNGPMIETGFEPAFLIIKRTDSTANWRMLDNKRSPNNPRDKELYPNLTNAEGTFSCANFYSNGFELITSDANYNASGGTYLYMAIAADPSTTTPSLASSFDIKENASVSASSLDVTMDFGGQKSDIVWVKSMDYGYTHLLWDSVRGAGNDKGLFVSENYTMGSTTGEGNAQAYGYISSFNTNGFSLAAGTTNGNLVGVGSNSIGNYISYGWKVGGLASINTTGSSTSLVSVNQAAGLSIAEYTGTGSAATIAHGLGVVPKMTIIKGLTGTPRNWVVFHSDLTAYTYEVYLSDQGSEYNSAGAMQAAAPTSTLISLGTDDYCNGSGNRYICYSFAEVTGFSSFGKYTASGSVGSPTITTGFEPDWVMIKNIDRTQEWIMVDSVRGLNKSLIPDSVSAQSANGNTISTSATGFTIEVSGGGVNYASGDTMIYAAFKIN